jgi:uncharacterized protein YndB with AHSA1/START domain
MKEIAMSTRTLQVTTPSDREIAMTRLFDAPRRPIFDALTRPDMLKRWLHGPDGWSLSVCEVDLTVGGAYRFVWHRRDGTELGLGGVHREIVSPERIVRTELFDRDWTGGEALATTILVEQDGRTTLTTTVLYRSQKARDGALESGMVRGVSDAFDSLADLLAWIARRLPRSPKPTNEAAAKY